MKRFFNKEWEREQTEKLLKKHLEKVDKLEKELEKKGVFSKTDPGPLENSNL